MTIRDTIIERLSKALSPTLLEVIDESHKHAGHAGAREGGESHFKVIIKSDTLVGNRLAQHRNVMALVNDLNIHALSIEIR